jgi:hypothetical protein
MIYQKYLNLLAFFSRWFPLTSAAGCFGEYFIVRELLIALVDGKHGEAAPDSR